METILIFGTDKVRAELLSREWESDCDVSFLVFDELTMFLRHLRQATGSTKGVIILKDTLSLESKTSELQGIQDLPPLLIETENFSEAVRSYFLNLGVLRESEKTDDRFVSVRFYDFMTFSIAPCDLFIRMGTDNFVKIINQGDLYTQEILDNYRDKKISHLSIQKTDFDTYQRDLSKILQEQLQQNQRGNKKLLVSIAGLDYVNDSMKSLGMDAAAIELAGLTLKSVLATISTEPDIYKKVCEFLSVRTYLSEHSIATAALSCAIARNMEMTSDFTLNKLVIAALFHDIALQGKELSLIICADSNEYHELSDEKKKEFSQHVFESIAFVKKLSSVPANVESIILEHHERPNGKGFPRGLDSFSISPLGCVFILAEEFTHHIFRQGVSPKNRDAILERLSHEFDKGHFKKPLRELLKLFL